MSNQLLQLAIEAAKQAGGAIMGHYQRIGAVEFKGDGSPLTQADKDAHRVIVGALLGSAIPVVSEESEDLCMDARRYWLVDPLDGTKDFLAANDEFTVNIALVDENRPILGVVYAPALREMYVGQVGIGSWCEKEGCRAACVPAGMSASYTMAVSRFHDHQDVDVFAHANGIGQRIAIGSALKYGRLATAEVDVFPRLVGSSEWDTAAGQAVLEGAGGQVLDWETGVPLCYGKPRRRNPRLLSTRAPYTYAAFNIQHYEQGIS